MLTNCFEDAIRFEKDIITRLERIRHSVHPLLLILVFERFFVHEHKDDSSLVNSLPSIAVLPFADMSPNKDQDYFSGRKSGKN